MTAETMKVTRLLPSRGKVYPNPILTEDEEGPNRETTRDKKMKGVYRGFHSMFVEGTSFQNEREREHS